MPFRKPHPIRGILWGLIMGIGAAAIAILLKIIPFELVWALIVLGGGILLGILWSTLGPAKKPKGEPPWRPAEEVTSRPDWDAGAGAAVTTTPARRRTPPHPAARRRTARHRLDRRRTSRPRRCPTGVPDRWCRPVVPDRWCRTRRCRSADAGSRPAGPDPEPPPHDRTRHRRRLRHLRRHRLEPDDRTVLAADRPGAGRPRVTIRCRRLSTSPSKGQRVAARAPRPSGWPTRSVRC